MKAAQAKAVAGMFNREYKLHTVELEREGARYAIAGHAHFASFELADPADSYAVDLQPTVLEAGEHAALWQAADWQPLATYPAETLAWVARAMAAQDVRHYLQGLAIYPAGIVATDGHRLHFAGSVDGDAAIIPRPLVALALRLQKKGAIRLEIDRSLSAVRILLDCGAVIGGTLLDGRYPNCNRVIPDTDDFRAAVVSPHTRQQLTQAAGIAASESKYREVVLHSSVTTPAGTPLPLSIEPLDGCMIGVNCAYLADAIEPKAGAVLRYRDAMTAVVVERGDCRAVIMPMRIDASALEAIKAAAEKAAPTPPAALTPAHRCPQDVQDRPRMAAMAGARDADTVTVEPGPRASEPACAGAGAGAGTSAAPDAIQWPEHVQVSARLSSPAKVAAIIKKELAAIGIPATVKSSRYSMGDSVRVELQDVPPSVAKEIEARYEQYQYGHFNGMEDIYESTNVRRDIPQTKHLFIERNYSEPIKQAAWQWLLDTVPMAGKDALPSDITAPGFQHARIWGERAPEILWRVLSDSARLPRERSFWADFTGGNRPCPPSGGKGRKRPSKAPDGAPASPAACRIEQHHHTRGSFDMWIVNPGERMERERFETARDGAKAAGGWYSRQWGSTPGGFAFKDRAGAERFAASIVAAAPEGDDTTAPPPAAAPASVAPSEPSQASNVRLKCATCGGEAGHWQQWPNQDNGFGVCADCVAWLTKRGVSAEEIRRRFGSEGAHRAPGGSAMAVYGWDPVRLSEAYTRAELVRLMRTVQAQHLNPVDDRGHPLESGKPTIYLYDRTGRQRLEAIQWAITHSSTAMESETVH